MLDKIKKISEEAKNDLSSLVDAQALEAFKEKYFNKKDGVITSMFNELKTAAADIRPQAGSALNTLRKDIEEILVKKGVGGSNSDAVGEEWLDPTISTNRYRLGNLHPMTQLISELSDSFRSMGFMVLDGPELESDFYNFEALNIPEWHPAREAQDTFYVEAPKDQKWVMRTHTTSVQVRAMKKFGAPLRCVVPGRVFRNEATDASHEHTFYQFDCVLVDENVTIANLIATLKELVSAIYKKEMQVRLRPGYFPFVEPGFELDMSCTFCDGKGCPVCKHTGWIEMGGSGMIHPNVLKYGGIDPKKYSGFAFGMGITRLLMMKYGIDEIRLMQGGDLRFLKQF